MDIFYTILITFIITSILICTIVKILHSVYKSNVRKRYHNNKTKRKTYNPSPTPPDEKYRQEEAKIKKFWEQATEYLLEYISDNDFESATEFILNIWTTHNQVEYARELHDLLHCALYPAYPKRNDSDKAYHFVVFICELDISNIENYVKKGSIGVNNLYIMNSVEKLVIMLEKAGRIEEAIAICDIGIQYNIMDSGYKDPEIGYTSFERRKEHLIKKLQKHQHTSEDRFKQK